MPKNRAGITVHAIDPVPPGGPVFYASLPGASEACKERLIATLSDHLQATATPLWNHCRPSGKVACPIQLVSGQLGKPHFHLGESRGPAISFSRGGGKIWAALAGDESDIGIDVAGSAEFQGAYPFQRVFHPDELHHALQLTDGELEGAAALLWSVKEAVVKALGCGFHLVEPRQISVYAAAGGEGGYTFPVGLSGKALARFPMAAGRFLWVHSLLQGKLWLSIAVIKSLQVDHE